MRKDTAEDVTLVAADETARLADESLRRRTMIAKDSTESATLSSYN